MSKTFLFKMLLAGVFLVAAVLWLLSLVMEETFGFFNLSWAVFIISGTWSIAFILNGLFSKTVGTFKKLYIMMGAGLAVIALFAVINIFVIEDAYIVPIICIIVAAAFLLSIIAVGGKKWDQGDNKNVGYKNYHQRKAAEEKQKKRNEDN